MNRLIVVFISLLFSITGFSQADTLPPYKQVPFVPPFKIQLANGSWFGKDDLQKKPTIILYFSPDCGHCQIETDDLLSKPKILNKYQVIMVTSRSLDEMKAFSDKYMIHKFPGIKIGSDTERFISHFYKVKFTPFSAVYNKKGELIKVYEKGIDYENLQSLVP